MFKQILYKKILNFLLTAFWNLLGCRLSEETNHTMNETEILKYALTFLLSNIDENVMEDIADYIGESSQEELEAKLQEMIDTII